MDDCGPRNAEIFEEMKVSQFKWLLRDVCIGLPSLKKASKYQAIYGIILSFLFMVPGFVGCYFLFTGLGSRARLAYTLAYVFGAGFLVVGTLLFIYNFILLRSVRDNNGARVFKIIKIGSLILLYLQLITKSIIFVGLVALLADPSRYPTIQTGGWIEFLANLLDLFLTSLAIYGIHCAKPKMVSWYIYFIAIVFVIEIFFFGFFAVYALSIVVPALYVLAMISLIFAVILVGLMMTYYLNIFALHVNMMNIAAVNNNFHHYELIKV